MKNLLALFSIFLGNISFASQENLENDVKEVRANIKGEQSLNKCFYSCFGRFINFDDPKTFNEKIMWRKLYEVITYIKLMDDKLCAKNYVEKKIGAKYIVQLYDYYDCFDAINFDQLPNKFILKTTLGSFNRGNLICYDKEKFDKIEAKKKFDSLMQKSCSKGKIIAEELLENNGKPILEYKIFCFNGCPRFVLNWQLCDDQNFKIFSVDDYLAQIQKSTNHNESPKLFTKILDLSRVLSAKISHVRVDWYVACNVIKFGELTFFSSGGLRKFPDGVDEMLGAAWILPKVKIIRSK